MRESESLSVQIIANQREIIANQREQMKSSLLRRLTSPLLRFDKPGGSVDTNNETSSDFGIQRATVTSFVNSHHSFDPSNNLKSIY